MKVYVAGPDVFLKNAKDHLEQVRALLKKYDMEALIPLDNEVTGGIETDIAGEIYKGNVAMIDSCDAVVANIEPFRGVHMDPGTAFEIGYAVAKGKKVYCYTSYARSSMLDRFNGMWVKENDEFRDVNEMLIENFGETENLMITVPSLIFGSLEHAVKALKANLGC